MKLFPFWVKPRPKQKKKFILHVSLSHTFSKQLTVTSQQQNTRFYIAEHGAHITTQHNDLFGGRVVVKYLGSFKDG